ncbi:MAG: ABC transporter ATP-binding protein, partial [Candidatus Rokuibacteriota bacterium]
MLEARGISKSYISGRPPIPALVDVDLDVAPGEFVAVCGPSGSGKSTLLAVLGGLCRPREGRVLVDGVDLWALAPDALADFRARRLGFVFQFASLLPSLRALDNVVMPALLTGTRDLVGDYARAEALLRHVGLGQRLDAYPGELSGGEQRRVALARALVNRPRVILADEPTSDLDETTADEIFDRLVPRQRAGNSTLVLVTHSAELAKRADRVILLQGGRVVESTRAHPVLARVGRADDAAPTMVETAAGRAPLRATVPPRPFGSGLRRLLCLFAVWTVLVVAGVLAVDLAVASWQQRATAQRHLTRSALERAALQQLRADVEDVAYDADGSYRLTLYLQNMDPGRDLFVLAPAPRVFVQAARGWEEMPSRGVDAQDGTVVKVTGRHRFVFTFKPELRAFAEQLAGYYHVRISNAMLVSRSRE